MKRLSPPHTEIRRNGRASEVLNLPFDQYQRYRLVADLVDQMRGDGAPLNILDVGGRTGLLRRFLPNDTVTLLDPEDSDQSGLVLGLGSQLPFKKGAFDVVTACDTLEHVPPAVRDAFVQECGRVGSRWVILAGPYKDPRVDDAETILLRFLREKLGIRHRYLEEHRTYGLPARDRVEGILSDQGAKQVASFGHGNLERWLALMCLAMYMDEDPPLRRFATLFYRFYNQALYSSDHSSAVYRHAVVACFDEAQLPDEKSLFDPVGLSDNALAPFTELIGELVAFDRERDVYDAERGRLLKVNQGLLRDLEGHRDTLTTMQDDLDSHRDVVTRLREELEEHRGHQTEMETELDRVNKMATTLNGQLTETVQELRAIKADLKHPVKVLKRVAHLAKSKYIDREAPGA